MKNEIVYGQFFRDHKLYKGDTSIEENTPILFEDKVVGHTVGENKVGYPIKCVLYSQFLNKQEMLDTDNSYKVVSLTIEIKSENLLLKRDCKDCIHFNVKSLQDKSQFHCLKFIKSSACFGCPHYKLKELSKKEMIKELK